MGLFRRVASVLLGSSETDLIRAKKEIQYNAESLRNKEITITLEKMVGESYEESLEQILHRLGNAARHHANLTSANHLTSGPFMEKFVNSFAFDTYTKGVSLGHQLASGTADSKFQEEIGLLLDDDNKKMLTEAKKYFSHIEAECFTIAAHTAFELGVQAGSNFYDQEYIATRR